MIDLIVLNLVSGLGAVTWAMWLRPRPMSLAPAAVVVAHLVIVQAWVLGTGLIGALDIVGWRLAAGLVAMVVLAVWVARPGWLVAERRAWGLRAGRVWRLLGAWRVVLGGLVLGGMAGWLAVVGYLVGPYMPDIVAYHLAPPTDWIADGRVTDRNWLDPRAWWPQGNGLLSAWWMLPAGTIRAFHGSELQWLALCAAVAWALARQMGGTNRTAWLAAVVMAAVPVIWAQAMAGLNDVAVSALALAAVAAVSGRRVTWRNAGLAAAALLLGLGVKPTMLLIAPGIVAVGAWTVWRRWDSGGRARHGACGAGAWAALLAAALVLGAGWYVRNAVAWENPLYPATLRVGDRELLTGHPYLREPVGHVRTGRLGPNLADMALHRMWDHRRPRTPVIEDGSGFGPLAVGLGLAAALGLLVGERRSRPMLAAAGLMALTIGAGVRGDEWIGRFFSFVPILLAVCAAVAAGRMAPGAPRAIWIAMLIGAGVCSAAVGASITLPTMARLYWETQGMGPIPPRVLLLTPYTHLLDSVEGHVGRDEPLVLVAPRFQGPVALLHGESLGRTLVYYHGLPGHERVERWRAEGLRWVVALATPEQLHQIHPWLVQRGLSHTAEGLYEIR